MKEDRTSMESNSEPSPESVYREFWAPIIAPNGIVELELLKNELFDFWQVMQSVPKVYRHVTGDKVSKVMTDPNVVCALADDFYSEIEE
jgi:hypothetical protein